MKRHEIILLVGWTGGLVLSLTRQRSALELFIDELTYFILYFLGLGIYWCMSKSE